LKDTPEQFDLVITDQTTPEMTGILLARKLLQIRPDIPIILCTGYSDLVTKDYTRELGIRVLLMKPLVTQNLARSTPIMWGIV
jgi:two-component system, cell cycle sensor histidine kinase and response regulator CckA